MNSNGFQPYMKPDLLVNSVVHLSSTISVVTVVSYCCFIIVLPLINVNTIEVLLQSTTHDNCVGSTISLTPVRSCYNLQHTAIV